MLATLQVNALCPQGCNTILRVVDVPGHPLYRDSVLVCEICGSLFQLPAIELTPITLRMPLLESNPAILAEQTPAE